MSIFDSIGSQRATNAQTNTRGALPNAQRMQQARQQFSADPIGTLRGCGLNIPDGMTDPRQIAMHLFQSGQIGRNGLMTQR